MTGRTAAGRSERRTVTRRRRRLAGVALVLVLALLAAAGVALLSGGSDRGRVAQAEPVATSTTTTTVPATTVTTAPPPASVATTKVASLDVFDAPDSARVVTSLSAKTDYLVPRTLLVTEQQGDWLKTLLPIRPNGATGWVRASDVSLSQNPYRITVNLADHTVILWKDGREILSSSAVIGSARTPTPLGTFYITDPVDLTSSPGGSYGAYALGLSGFSEVLFSFNGGPGQIAIHGTNQPGLMGQNVSNGCIRVPNDVIVEIARQAPLGTPVVIT